ncbi:MAG TPA: PaaI family thioesterase [Limnochordales bacterium]
MTWMRYWSSGCFVCGRENPDGLNATVLAGGGRSHLLVSPRQAFAGFPGMLHGGIVAALLDEAMWYAAYAAGVATLTGSLEVRFVRPAPPGGALLVTGSVQEPREGEPPGSGAGLGRWVVATARMLDGDGRLVASARGRFAPAAVLQGMHTFIRSQPAEAELLARARQWPGL